MHCLSRAACEKTSGDAPNKASMKKVTHMYTHTPHAHIYLLISILKSNNAYMLAKFVKPANIPSGISLTPFPGFHCAGTPLKKE